MLFMLAVPQEFQPAFEVELLGNERDVATLDMSCFGGYVPDEGKSRANKVKKLIF